MFGFGPGNQNVGRHAKLAAVKLLPARDVLRRFSLKALVQVAAVVNPGALAEFFVGVRVEIGAVALEGVGEENFGGQARDGDRGVFQQLRALQQSCLDGHGENGARPPRPGLPISHSDSSW